MNDIYIHALKASENNGQMFVVFKSLDEIMVDKKKICGFLKDGYEIRTTCINGTMHDTWKIDDKDVIKSIERYLKMKLDCNFLFVKTQQFFDNHYNSEGTRMLLELWKENEKPETIVYFPETEKTAQEKTQHVLDVIYITGQKQYKDMIMKLYK